MNLQMPSIVSRSACTALLCLAPVLTGASAANWPQFRGPQASGVAAQAVPTQWDVSSKTNVLWTADIPGLAHASPIVWDDKIYVATAVRPGEKPKLKVGLYGDVNSYSEKEAHQWRLLCLDKASGRILWNQMALEAVPRLQRHTKATHCNSTPATDGQHLVALFGSEGLFCFDMTGAKLWHKDLGKLHAGWVNSPKLQWGFASSPILHDGRVVAQVDTISEQFLAVFDAADGREMWRVPRKESNSWCTPLVATTLGRTQIVLNGWKDIGGYDFKTGQSLWSLREGGDVPVASPVVAGDLVILTSAHGRYRPMRAVRLDATGDMTPPEISQTNAAVIWCHPRKGNYMQTPIVVGDLLWGCTDDGVVSCFDVQTGHVHYQERLGRGGQGFTASPVAAAGKLYFTGEQGDVFVLDAAKNFQVLATNKLDGICLATPALSDGALFFRTTEKVVAIGTRK